MKKGYSKEALSSMMKRLQAAQTSDEIDQRVAQWKSYTPEQVEKESKRYAAETKAATGGRQDEFLDNARHAEVFAFSQIRKRKKAHLSCRKKTRSS